MRIADQTERELIESVLKLYAQQNDACAEIAHHIAIKLADRRKLIRERKRKP